MGLVIGRLTAPVEDARHALPVELRPLGRVHCRPGLQQQLLQLRVRKAKKGAFLSVADFRIFLGGRTVERVEAGVRVGRQVPLLPLIVDCTPIPAV